MAIDRYYTPQTAAKASGLYVSQCRALIMQSPGKVLISRDPGSKKPRYIISERDFQKVLEENRRRAMEKEIEKLPPAKRERRKQVLTGAVPGLTPDGKIMTRKQMKEAGLWKEEKK